MSILSRADTNEEIDFFRDFCGWSDRRIEEKLNLAEGTLAQRKHRAARIDRALAAGLTPDLEDEADFEWGDAA